MVQESRGQTCLRTLQAYPSRQNIWHERTSGLGDWPDTCSSPIPPPPAFHSQTSRFHAGNQGDRAFLPHTPCLVTCQGALPGSIAGCQRREKRLDGNRHPLEDPCTTHTWTGGQHPTTLPFSRHLAGHLLVSGKRRKQGGEGRKGNLLEIFV